MDQARLLFVAGLFVLAGCGAGEGSATTEAISDANVPPSTTSPSITGSPVLDRAAAKEVCRSIVPFTLLAPDMPPNRKARVAAQIMTTARNSGDPGLIDAAGFVVDNIDSTDPAVFKKSMFRLTDACSELGISIGSL